jgi:hypothetical protein
MAQRRSFVSLAIGFLLPGGPAQAEEAGSVPTGAGDGGGDPGQADKGLAAVDKAIGHYSYMIRPSVPGPHQLGSRLDPPRQLQPAVGLY